MSVVLPVCVVAAVVESDPIFVDVGFLSLLVVVCLDS